MADIINLDAYRLQNGGQAGAFDASNGQNTHTECNLTFEEHLKYVDALVLAGIIDETTGKSMKQQITANFPTKTRSNTPFQATGVSSNPASAFDFSQSEFLKARNCLLKYLQNLDIQLSEADLKEIESVVLELEKAAITASLDKNGQEALMALKNTNEIAKERLITGPIAPNGLQNAPQKVFSRDEIAKMSTAEFIKNEPIINYQLQNGLL